MSDVDRGIVKPNWDLLELNVVERIRALRATAEKLDAPEEWREKIWNDLIVPNVRLLAEFCVNIRFSEDDNNEGGTE